jgi:hypothetical protein
MHARILTCVAYGFRCVCLMCYSSVLTCLWVRLCKVLMMYRSIWLNKRICYFRSVASGNCSIVIELLVVGNCVVTCLEIVHYCSIMHFLYISRKIEKWMVLNRRRDSSDLDNDFRTTAKDTRRTWWNNYQRLGEKYIFFKLLLGKSLP